MTAPAGLNNPDALHSSPYGVTYAQGVPLAQDVDLVAEGGAPCRGLRVGIAGDIVLQLSNGVIVPFKAAQIGEPIPYQAVKILVTGGGLTTAAQWISVFW